MPPIKLIISFLRMFGQKKQEKFPRLGKPSLKTTDRHLSLSHTHTSSG